MKRRPRPRYGPPLPDAEVFELTDEMAVPAAPQPSFRKVEPQNDLEFTESAAAKSDAGARFRHRPLKTPAAPPPSRDLVALDGVGGRIRLQTAAQIQCSANNARTLEDLVKEMLRPMLKSWLDDNLPGLVERIVKAEIERVSRGR